MSLGFELGDALQFDWSVEGLAAASTGGSSLRTWSHAPRAIWLVAYPTQGHEMLLDVHTRTFWALGGIPRRGIYDNMNPGADKVNECKGRALNARDLATCAHYLFDPDFCNAASGREKGLVEKNVGDSRRRVWFEAARQRCGSIDELNVWLAVRCRALRQQIRHPEHGQLSVAGIRGEPGARV